MYHSADVSYLAFIISNHETSPPLPTTPLDSAISSPTWNIHWAILLTGFPDAKWQTLSVILFLSNVNLFNLLYKIKILQSLTNHLYDKFQYTVYGIYNIILLSSFLPSPLLIPSQSWLNKKVLWFTCICLCVCLLLHCNPLSLGIDEVSFHKWGYSMKHSSWHIVDGPWYFFSI